MKVIWEHTEVQNGLWNVIFSNVAGEYELSGLYLTQGFGSVQNTDFYFRAKDNQWEFETNDEKGWLFPADDKHAFRRMGQYAKGDILPHQKAAEIIAECVAEFVLPNSSLGNESRNLV